MDNESEADPQAPPDATTGLTQPPPPEPPPDPSPPQPQDTDPYAAIADGMAKQQRAALRTSLLAGSQKNPDAHAKAIALADPYAVKPQAVADNLDVAKTGAFLHSADPEGLLNNHPELASWLMDHDNAAIAHDDLDQLKRVSSALQPAPANNLIGLIDSYDRLRQQSQDAALVDDAVDVIRQHNGFVGTFGVGVFQTVESTKQAFKHTANWLAAHLGVTGDMFDQAAMRSDQALADAQGAASERLYPGILGGLGRQSGGLLADAPLLAAGGPLGEAAGSLTKIARLSNALKAAGAMLPQAVRGATNVASQEGPTQGALDLLVNTAVPGAFGGAFGMHGLTKALTQSSTVESAISQPGAASLAELSNRLLKEAGFQGSQMATLELANALRERINDPTALDPAKLAKRMADSASFGALTGALFTLPHEVRSMMERRIIDAHYATDSANHLLEAVQAVQGSKVAERSPARMQDLISGLVGDNSHLYFNQEKWDEHWNGQGVDPLQAAEKAGVAGEYLKAKSTGGDIQIPADRGVMSLADSKNPEDLVQHVRMHPEAKTAAEAGATIQSIPDEIQKMTNEAAEEAAAAVDTSPPEQTSIRDAITTASLAAGRSPDEAALHGRVLEKIVSTLAERSGVDPQEFFQRLKLALRGQQGEGIPAETAALSQEPHVVKGRNVVVADVPYGGGTSQDGKTVYIDRRIPRFHDVDGKKIDLHEMIAEHEIAEKERMDRGESYSKAHNEATKIEDADVDHQGISHEDYENLLKPYLDEAKKAAAKENIPADIEPKPYRDMGETHLIDGAIGQARDGISSERPLEQPPLAIQPKGESLRSNELLKQWRKAMGEHGKFGGDELWMKLQEQSLSEDYKRGVYYQNDEDKSTAGPQGTFLPARLNQEGQNLITFLAGADRSTFFHETGHLLLEVMHDLASKDDAPAQIKDDLGKIRTWLGAEDGKGIESITRAQHEQFARGLETYLMEGKPPSEGLRGAFKRIKSWLLKLYQGYTDFGVPLSDDIRGVFDRIHATDAEIAQAEARERVSPLFATPEQAGKTPEEFAAYRKTVERAHDEAIERLQTKLARALKAQKTKVYAEERDALHRETSATVDKLPVYVALDAMQDGKVPAGVEMEKGQTLKLGKEFLVRDFGKEILDLLPGPRKDGEERPNAGHTIYADGGMDLEEAARVYGFDDGHSMVRALLSAPDREAHIEALVDAEMQRRHPDPMDDPAQLKLEATKAIAAGESHGEVLHAELEALRKLEAQSKALVRQKSSEAASNATAVAEAKAARRDDANRLKAQAEDAAQALRRNLARQSIPDIRVIREAARRTVLKTTVKDLRPSQYLAAARRFSNESSKHYIAGNYEKAAAAKQRELLNHELYRAALDAVSTVRKTRDFLKSMNASDVRRKIVRAAAREGAGNDYMAQIDGVLSRVDLKQISAENLATRESLERWMARMTSEGKSVAIPEELANESYRRNWKQLTTEQFLAVGDAVKNIAHLAEHANDVSALAEKTNRDALVAELTKAAQDNGSPPRKANITTTFGDEMNRKASGFNLSLTKLSFLLKRMDGGKMGGVWWNTISRVLNRNDAHEIELRQEDAQRWTEARKAWGKDAGPDKWNSPYIAHYDPALGSKISLMGRIMVLLNYGTAKNRERLLNGGLVKGEKLTEAQVQHIIDSLDAKDVAYAKSIWDLVGSHRQELEAQSRRLSGVVPKWEDGLPIQTRFGEISGKYFPIRYDTEEGARRGDAVFSTDSQAYSYSPSTNAGFLAHRTETTGLRLRLDETAISGHLAEVAHRLAHEDAMQAFGKILRNKDVYDAITGNFGVPAYRTIRDTILRVAQGDYRENDSKILAGIRRGVTIFHQGYNVLTSMFNLTGIVQSMTRVPPQYFLKAISDIFPGNASETAERLSEAAAKSKVLAHHEQYFIREQRELMNQQSLRSFVPGMATLEKHGYLLQRMTQKFADHIVWRAAFEQAIREFPEDEQKAIDVADQQVLDTQSSGAMKDLPGIQTGGEAKKLLTMFYTWFSSRHNLTTEAFSEARRAGFFTSRRGAPAFGLKMLTLYTVPIVIEGMLMAGIRKACGGKDDDKSVLEWLAREHLAAFMSNYPGVRELANAALNRPYNGPTIIQPVKEASQVAGHAVSGDFDKIQAAQMIDLLGMGLHLPLAPVSRAVRGFEHAQQTDDNPVAPMIFGPPHRN